MNKMKVMLIISLMIFSSFSFGGQCLSARDPSGSTGMYPDQQVVVYAADSLKEPMERFKVLFERWYGYGSDHVQMHYAGSNKLIQEITEDKTTPDIIFSADYKLIDDRLVGDDYTIGDDYTHYNIQFARNSVVIAYRRNSKNSSIINGDNWFNVLNQSDVRFGFGNPNQDPCGYRSVMVFALANKFKDYANPSIFDLISTNSNIYKQSNETDFDIYSPTTLTPTTNILINDHAADSLESLKHGSIDYAFVYRNQAEEAKSDDPNIDYVTLPNELSLNDAQYEEEYSHIRLTEFCDDPARNKTITLTPVVYGFTGLKVGKYPDAASEFLKEFVWVTSDEDLPSYHNDRILQYMDHIYPYIPSKRTTISDIPGYILDFGHIGGNQYRGLTQKGEI
ncbi:MAG: substrate-binding domain-containing protein [Methanobrevibacter sp.]|jgi:molybdate/tungstate transport system substrate-binding protein|nr:substrate-binding domain-containing protein [Candidatus Methanovirga meridionalis]